MPRCCSIQGCKSNYRSQSERVTTFALPKCEELKNKWLRTIPSDFTGLKKPVICIKHFQEDDVITTDKCVVKGKVKEFQRKIPKLKDDAVPSIFSDLPSTKSRSKRSLDVSEDDLEPALKQRKTDQEELIKEKEGLSSLEEIRRCYEKYLEVAIAK
ncbi:uncharacterized protein LOC129217406 [Uloborus diversus]|uniref:uncharacterized protein LOC129217406 n=1 Tax=Uloborus diversus TaxID=327109 RepID=UPI002409602B|nr:uncharacterized protein LOC129217406 [Uloborus diversus]